MRNRSVITILLLYLLAFSSYSYSVQKERIPSREISHNLKITIEDIQYISDDKYSMVIGFTNLSTDTLHININKLIVAVQTDVIGTRGWIKTLILGIDIPQELLLTTSEIKKKEILLEVPSEKNNNLYKTYEGDISLKIEYEVLLKKGSYIGKKMDEIYLWLRPKTNKWVHREGM